MPLSTRENTKVVSTQRNLSSQIFISYRSSAWSSDTTEGEAAITVFKNPAGDKWGKCAWMSCLMGHVVRTVPGGWTEEEDPSLQHRRNLGLKRAMRRTCGIYMWVYMHTHTYVHTCMHACIHLQLIFSPELSGVLICINDMTLILDRLFFWHSRRLCSKWNQLIFL